jgi:hypothetical protein
MHVAVNIKLRSRFTVDRSSDSMGRTWVGWDETVSDQVNWDHNRGRHTFGSRVDAERYATLSYDGRIRLVARLTGRREESNARGTWKKWSLLGEVLRPGDPLREAFLRIPAPAGRNTIAYFDDPTDTQTDTFLLTNNPAKWEIDRDLITDWINATNAGHTVEWNWSTGVTTRKIVPGDRAFLLRQGVPVRGVFASGSFVSAVYQAEHWDGSGSIANYADVRWDTVINPDHPLQVETLRQQLPEGLWEPQASGAQVKATVVPDLERLWSAHVASVRGRSGGPLVSSGTLGQGQGRRLDERLRRQIEDLAQERLTTLYQVDGWEVEDLRHGNPFDAKATKDGEVTYLEAKGTTTAGESVIVTRNEVTFAREHAGRCVMGILAGIRVDDNDNVDPTSGELTLYEWDPADDDLKPLSFDFYPPEEQRL